MSNPIIKQIVDRCYVADSNRKVIRYLVSRLRRGYRTFRTLSRPQRRELMAQAIAVHQKNRRLYIKVMRGSFE